MCSRVRRRHHAAIALASCQQDPAGFFAGKLRLELVDLSLRNTVGMTLVCVTLVNVMGIAVSLAGQSSWSHICHSQGASLVSHLVSYLAHLNCELSLWFWRETTSNWRALSAPRSISPCIAFTWSACLRRTLTIQSGTPRDTLALTSHLGFEYITGRR